MKTSTEYGKTCCAAESNVRLWRRKRKYERTLKRLWTSIDTISEETHHKDTKAKRMQRRNEVHAKAPRRKERSESQGILPYFAPWRLCVRSHLCLSLWPVMSVLLYSVSFCGEIHFFFEREPCSCRSPYDFNHVRTTLHPPFSLKTPQFSGGFIRPGRAP